MNETTPLPEDSTEDLGPTFADLGLSPSVLSAVKKIGYETPSSIQMEAIPVLLKGLNLLGTAQTGTGKTAAFALPLLSMIDEGVRKPQILVLTPTRELSIQVSEAFQKYASEIPDFHVLPLYGGQDIGVQFRALRRGPQVIVGTPGRLTDHLRRDSLDLNGLKAIVLDEADEMLKMGFEDDLRAILGATPPTIQRALFSATMPNNLKSIVDEHLGEYEEVRIRNRTATVEKINQRFLMVRHDHKVEALARLLEHETFDAMLVFVRTKAASAEVATRLEARGFAATPLSGDLSQQQRERTIGRLKDGSVDIVVATDVAARGLDVDRITHVLNFDVPYDTESYVHRIGRTGRAGREGNAILFITPRERSMLGAIERATRQKITPMELPTHDQILSKRVGEFKTRLLEIIEKEDLEKFGDLVENWAGEESVDMADMASALLFLAQKDQPFFEKMAPIAEFKPPVGDRYAGREDRPQRPDRPGGTGFAPEPGYERYYIGIGREHRLSPGDVVGAIANEAGIDSKHIGRIKLYAHFSTVELQQGLPQPVLDVIATLSIRGRPAQMRIMTEDPPPDEPRFSRPRGDFGGRPPRGDFGGGRPGGAPRWRSGGNERY